MKPSSTFEVVSRTHGFFFISLVIVALLIIY